MNVVVDGAVHFVADDLSSGIATPYLLQLDPSLTWPLAGEKTMDKNRRRFLGMGSLALLGFSSVASAEQPQERFVHVMFFQFKPDVSEEERAELMHELARLKDTIPVLKEHLVGENMAAGSPEYHYALVSVFEKAEDLAVYEKHPEHEALARRVIPKIARGFGMDFMPF